MQSFRQNHHQAELEKAEVTIEFLRARLVSERSMCKAARERVLQLEEKIVQLEHMLEGEIVRRKKSELTTKELLLSLQYPVGAPPIKQQQRDYYAGKDHASTNNNRDSGCNCKFRTIFSFPRSSHKATSVASSSPSRNYQHSSSKYDGSSPQSTATSATYTTITSEGYSSAITYDSIKPGSTKWGSYNSSSTGNSSSLQVGHGINNNNNRYSQEQEHSPIESWQQKFNQALIYEQQRQQQEHQQEEISIPPLEASPAEMINLQHQGLNVERSDHRVHQYTATNSTPQQHQQVWGSSGEFSDSMQFPLPRRIGKSCRTFKRRSDISR